MAGNPTKKKFRSQEWFDNPDNPGMTALYLERYLNFGLTRAELQSGKPLIGIAQTSPISRWSKCSTATRSTAWCSPSAATRPPRRC